MKLHLWIWMAVLPAVLLNAAAPSHTAPTRPEVAKSLPTCQAQLDSFKAECSTYFGFDIYRAGIRNWEVLGCSEKSFSDPTDRALARFFDYRRDRQLSPSPAWIAQSEELAEVLRELRLDILGGHLTAAKEKWQERLGELKVRTTNEEARRYLSFLQSLFSTDAKSESLDPAIVLRLPLFDEPTEFSRHGFCARLEPHHPDYFSNNLRLAAELAILLPFYTQVAKIEDYRKTGEGLMRQLDDSDPERIHRGRLIQLARPFLQNRGYNVPDLARIFINQLSADFRDPEKARRTDNGLVNDFFESRPFARFADPYHFYLGGRCQSLVKAEVSIDGGDKNFVTVDGEFSEAPVIKADPVTGLGKVELKFSPKALAAKPGYFRFHFRCFGETLIQTIKTDFTKREGSDLRPVSYSNSAHEIDMDWLAGYFKKHKRFPDGEYAYERHMLHQSSHLSESEKAELTEHMKIVNGDTPPLDSQLRAYWNGHRYTSTLIKAYLIRGDLKNIPRAPLLDHVGSDVKWARRQIGPELAPQAWSEIRAINYSSGSISDLEKLLTPPMQKELVLDWMESGKDEWQSLFEQLPSAEQVEVRAHVQRRFAAASGTELARWFFPKNLKGPLTAPDIEKYRQTILAEPDDEKRVKFFHKLSSRTVTESGPLVLPLLEAGLDPHFPQTLLSTLKDLRYLRNPSELIVRRLTEILKAGPGSKDTPQSRLFQAAQEAVAKFAEANQDWALALLQDIARSTPKPDPRLARFLFLLTARKDPAQKVEKLNEWVGKDDDRAYELYWSLNAEERANILAHPSRYSTPIRLAVMKNLLRDSRRAIENQDLQGKDLVDEVAALGMAQGVVSYIGHFGSAAHTPELEAYFAKGLDNNHRKNESAVALLTIGTENPELRRKSLAMLEKEYADPSSPSSFYLDEVPTPKLLSQLTREEKFHLAEIYLNGEPDNQYSSMMRALGPDVAPLMRATVARGAEFGRSRSLVAALKYLTAFPPQGDTRVLRAQLLNIVRQSDDRGKVTEPAFELLEILTRPPAKAP